MSRLSRSYSARLLGAGLASVLAVGVVSGFGLLVGRASTSTVSLIPTPTDTPLPTPPPQSQLGKVRVTLTPFATGLQRPVFLTNAGDGSGRVYIVEQAGRIKVAEANGQVHSQPFLDIHSLVQMNGELGMLGLAFSPQYKTTGLFYVSYSDLDGNTMVARYHVAATNPLRADPASAQVVLHIVAPDIPEHRGGMLAFGPDGYLYISVGDGGRSNQVPGVDPGLNGQRTNTLLGKLLRIDVEHPAAGKPYAIPPTNPFVQDPSADPEIWAYGVRNPWRFSFDRATGDLYLGDVGDRAREEIDFQPRSSQGGENYGWKVYEGSTCLQKTCSLLDYSAPIVTYGHSGGLCAVIGGYVYRGKRSPALQGIYLFGDVCSGRIFGLDAAGNAPGKPAQYRQLAVVPRILSAFGQDEAGELYAISLSTGTIYRVTAK